MRWTYKEERYYRKELLNLYIKKNLTITEVGKILNIGETSVFNRLRRLGIKTIKDKKSGFLNKRAITLPRKYSVELAELTGILLGDGHLSHFQVWVTLGNKERDYAIYIINLFKKIFGFPLKVSINNDGYTDLYIGSVGVVGYFKKMGLVQNKVKDQVPVPKWIFTNKDYCHAFLRGFFDTDGSVYKLRHGWQINYCNRSLNLLKGIREILIKLGFRPSVISVYKIYLTRKTDLRRFTELIGSSNIRKADRLKIMMGGSDSGNSSTL